MVESRIDNKNGALEIAVVFAMILGQGPAYVLRVGWALAQQLSKPRECQKSHKNENDRKFLSFPS